MIINGELIATVIDSFSQNVKIECSEKVNEQAKTVHSFISFMVSKGNNRNRDDGLA